MQVITLTPSALETHAARLAKAVEEDCPVRYDAIVAVWRGGSYVCDAFLRHFPAERYRARYDIKLQRPSTKRKQGRLFTLLKHLPYPLLNAMRMAESRILAMRRKTTEPSRTSEVDIPECLLAALKGKDSPEILVVDDAIDSGNTLSAIVGALIERQPKARISIAVMTETTIHPAIHADHTLYRNRTLIRFPWSSDYKNQ